MRIAGWSVLSLLVVAIGVLAQGTPPAPVQENLDTVLHAWEKSMTDLRSFAVEIERTTNDKALNTKDVFVGHAMFSKPNRARLQLYKKTNDKVYEKYICTGVYLYEYSPVSNKVRIHDMPQNKQGQQESFLSFLFGMGAEQAKSRYWMEYKGGDKHYHYISVKPKQEKDRSDFTEARLSLVRATHLPAQIWYHQANGNEITWNFSKAQVDVQIPLTYFQPDVPKGWIEEKVPSNGPLPPPATVRNKSQ